MVDPRLPLAIVGMACHFPGGVNSLDDYWKLLKNRKSGIRMIPPDRWNWERYTHPNRDIPARMVSKYSGFIDDFDRFDAAFFDISPREAKQMDPQQRWLLETTWEALEDGGVAPLSLRGTNVGVFIGIASHDYRDSSRGNPSVMDIHSGTSIAMSIAANRLSYMFDFRGPSVAVDTACSSGLVATFLACQSIWSGQASMALAGGANLIMTPNVSIGFSKASMLSVDGQCFSFDHRANGYVRGEGVGITLIKPLHMAVEDGDRIYAVIRRAEVNQDGRTSSLAVPGLDAQEAMLRAAYDGLDVNRIAYIEAHGTGTPVGDPIEARAIGNAIGTKRKEPCLIGSIKTNIGHLETASGPAGLIKAALALHYGEIPPQINFERANPNIPMDELGIKVATELSLVASGGSQPPLIGVNSFGFGGANAHIVLEQFVPQKTQPHQPEAERPYVLAISAKDDQALLMQASNYQTYLRDTNADPADITTAAGVRREHLPYRLAVVGNDKDELRNQLRSILNAPTQTQTEYTPGITGNPVFVFTGQGAQWWGMGQQLLTREPIYRKQVEQIDNLLRPLTGWSLLEEMTRSEHRSRIDETEVAQPAIFALQLGLVALWKDWGITPSMVLGHSVGEVAAAYTAGIYTIEDAVSVIYHRSQLQHSTRGKGAMAAVGLSVEEASDIITQYGDRVAIAAINSPVLVTISGEKTAIESIVDDVAQRGVFSRLLPINYAFHSPQMDIIHDEVLERLAHLQPQTATIPFVSTVTGDYIAGPEMNAGYWWANVRQPVLFAAAVKTVQTSGKSTYLEVGPHPALRYALQGCLEGQRNLILHSLHRDADESREMLDNLAALYVNGLPVAWKNVNQGSGQYIDLPRYPWQKKQYLVDSVTRRRLDLEKIDHPLLGVPQYGPQPAWRNAIDPRVLDYLPDHKILGSILLPAAAFLEMGLAVAHRLGGEHVVENLHIEKGLFISTDQVPTVDVIINEHDMTINVYSSTDEGETWEHHAVGTLRKRGAHTPPALELESLCASLNHVPPESHHHQLLNKRGYQFGPAFNLITDAWIAPKESLLKVDAPNLSITDYHAHPALLDACLQGVILTGNVVELLQQGNNLFLPASIGRVQLYVQSLPAHFWVYTRLIDQQPESILAEHLAVDANGTPLAKIHQARFDRADAQKTPHLLYQLEWEPRRLKERPIVAPQDFPAPAELMSAASQVDMMPQKISYEPDDKELIRIVLGIVQNTLIELGWDFTPGQAFSLDDAMLRLGIIERHRPLLQYHLEELAALGLLKPVDILQWQVLRMLEHSDNQTLLAELDGYPGALDTNLLGQVLTNLTPLYQGLVNPHEVLFPGGSSSVMRNTYRTGEEVLRPYSIIRGMLAGIDRPLRVLEVGAGTGALTQTVLPDLPLDYTFSDISPKFINEARQLFRAYKNVDYQIADITRPLKGSYDVIIASNVIHGMEDPQHSLEILRQNLVPGGMLIFMEVIRRDITSSCIFGILAEWWRWDEAHQQHKLALYSSAEWLDILSQAGFENAVCLEQLTHEHNRLHSVIAAAAPATQMPAILPITGQFVVIGEMPELTERFAEADLTVIQPGHALPEFDNLSDVTVICIDPDVLQSLHLAQTCHAGRVIVVVRDIQYVVEGDNCTSLERAPLIGLLRVIRNELSQNGWRLIDLGLDGTADDVLAEIFYWDSEPEVAYREGKRYVQRLHRANPTDLSRRHQLADSYGLQNLNPGMYSGLLLTEMPRQAPARGEVEVRVKAAGINFRDVMKVLGVYPGSREELASIGDDFAGTVVTVGADVTDFQPGDHVFGSARQAFRSYVTTGTRSLVKKPSRISFEHAAGIPTIFLTAHHALVDLARVQPGERILIHAATGGVGQAAVQIAKDIGLEIYATAGTPEKRALLQEQGITHVFSSRTLDFADQIMEVTAGRGVDAVLNSLAGDFIPKNLSVLAPFGRYLEIGKIDVYGDSPLGMAALRDNISFFVIDLPLLIIHRPREFESLLSQIEAKFESDSYQPIPTTVYPINEAVDTFRTIAAGKHIGKSVFKLDDQLTVGRSTQEGHIFRPDRSYLITGGGGGFGLETARWMAAQGARHLVLMSRSGPRDEATQEIIRGMEAAGASVANVRGDVTCEEDVRRVIAGIDPPLAGVIHAAMVLNDKLISEMEDSDFLEAFDPKARGAWNLHQATAEIPLEHFICFSSVSNIGGNIKQANYNAGNAYLESLAYYRRARGLPALTVNWGVLGDVGTVSRDEKMAAYLDAIGLKPMQTAIALRQLGDALALDTGQIVISEVDWSAVEVWASNPRMLEHVINRRDASASEEMLSARVRAMPAEERLNMLEQFLILTAAGVLNLEPERIDPEANFSTFGLDSMMAIEMTNTLNSQLDFTVPVSDILTRSTLHDLALLLLRHIESDIGSESETTLDLWAEAQLDPEIQAEPGAPVVTIADHLLLTGATGFLGAYLLNDLLCHTEAEITCLVRAESKDDAMLRVKDNLRSYDLWQEDFSARIHTLPGDISLPLLGLNEADFASLARDIDAIYHNAAELHLTASYADLKPTNVNSVQEILRLAGRERVKHVHYVSTIAVFFGTTQSSDNVVAESESPDPGGLLGGYTQSKWVAEQLVDQAKKRDIPCTIYRPGIVIGDSRTGITNTYDLATRMVKGCYQIGAYADTNIVLNIVPVDYVSRALVYISMQENVSDQFFHLTSPQATQLNNLIEWSRMLPLSMRAVSYSEWRKSILQQSDGDNALMPLMPLFPPEKPDHFTQFIKCQNTLKFLEGSGIECPTIDADLINTYERFLISSGTITIKDVKVLHSLPIGGVKAVKKKKPAVQDSEQRSLID